MIQKIKKFLRNLFLTHNETGIPIPVEREMEVFYSAEYKTFFICYTCPKCGEKVAVNWYSENEIMNNE